ncbi:MAG: hypothetical protein ACRDPD_10860, partial [Streptosporangiaceae bacterium]
DPAGSAWSFGGSILTFVFPEALFIIVAIALYVVYTKPETVPGRWVHGAERSVSYTSVPGQPPAAGEAPAAPAAASPTRAEMAGPAPAAMTATTVTTSDEPTGTTADEPTGTTADESTGTEATE